MRLFYINICRSASLTSGSIADETREQRTTLVCSRRSRTTDASDTFPSEKNNVHNMQTTPECSHFNVQTMRSHAGSGARKRIYARVEHTNGSLDTECAHALFESLIGRTPFVLALRWRARPVLYAGFVCWSGLFYITYSRRVGCDLGCACVFDCLP